MITSKQLQKINIIFIAITAATLVPILVFMTLYTSLVNFGTSTSVAAAITVAAMFISLVISIVLVIVISSSDE